MPIYIVERDLKGISESELAAAQKLAIGTSRDFSEKGTPVRYIRSTFTPETGRCACLFEANSAQDVKRLNEEARIPFVRVLDALDLTP
jgi:hypothetical protein